MRTIAVLNQKGGVGKTTSTVNIAAGLARMGKKVVLIDMDPQAHLTIHLGINPETSGEGIYEVLTQSAKIKEIIKEVRENLFLLGASINLVGAESELVSIVGREIILKEAIDDISGDFDYLIIDCAPSLGLLTLNALAAVNEVFIPLQPHFLALQGLGKLLQTVSLVSKRINPELKVSGVLLCMYDKRATLSTEVKSDIQKFLQNARDTQTPWSQAAIIPVFVRRNIKLAEAPSYGQTIFEYEPECNGSFDYEAIAGYVDKNMTKDGKHIKFPTESGQTENTLTEETDSLVEDIKEQPAEQTCTETQPPLQEQQSEPEASTEKSPETTEIPAKGSDNQPRQTADESVNIPIIEIPDNAAANHSENQNEALSKDLNTSEDYGQNSN